MVITDIIPCIKVIKENDMSGIDMYIDLGTKVKITDYEGNTVVGKMLPLELAKYEEEDDMIYILLDNGEQFSIGVSYIFDIEEL